LVPNSNSYPTPIDSNVLAILNNLQNKLTDLALQFQNILLTQENKKEERKEEGTHPTYTLKLEDETKEMNNFDAILELLNQKGNAVGYSFKKGVIKK